MGDTKLNKNLRLGFVVIGADQLMRDTLRLSLPLVEPVLHCLATACLTQDSLGYCLRRKPKLILFDLAHRTLDELSALRLLLEDKQHLSLVVIADSIPEYIVENLLVRRGCGMISRSEGVDTLVRACFLVAEGGTYCAASLRSSQEPASIELGELPFSQRERHVLQLIAEGYSTKQVADLLKLSIKTVEKYRTSIMQKIDVHDVVKLTHYAFKTGLIHCA